MLVQAKATGTLTFASAGEKPWSVYSVVYSAKLYVRKPGDVE